MANTSDILLSNSDWLLVATNPSAITIKSNDFNGWHVAVKDTAGAPASTMVGEVHNGYHEWESGSIAGSVYIRGVVGAMFSVTVQAGA